jgi:flagellar L-ring protein FlgH
MTSIFRPLLASLVLSSAVFAQVKTQPMDAPPPGGRTLTPEKAPPRDAPPPNLGQLMQESNGSLFRATASMPDDPRVIRASDVSPFTVPTPKPKLMQKHDLLTIIVREESSYKSEATTENQKTAKFDAKVSAFPKFNLADFALENAIGDYVPRIAMDGSRDFTGEGSVDRKDVLTARIQAEVVDVKPNGTLVLQARKRIKTDEEEQLFVLTGICRVQDITPDNTVLSTQLYDSDVRKTHTGAVRDASKRGWIPRAVDWINPF